MTLGRPGGEGSTKKELGRARDETGRDGTGESAYIYFGLLVCKVFRNFHRTNQHREG